MNRIICDEEIHLILLTLSLNITLHAYGALFSELVNSLTTPEWPFSAAKKSGVQPVDCTYK